MPGLREPLRAALDAEPVRPVLEYVVAERFGLAAGHVTVELLFRDGRLVRAFAKRGPMGVEELEALALPEAPPLPAAESTA